MKYETKQVYYNQVRGRIVEINNSENFPSVTITVGHSKTRHINVLCKKDKIQELVDNYVIGDDVCLAFFVSSRFKHDRWYSNVNCLEIVKKNNAPDLDALLD